MPKVVFSKTLERVNWNARLVNGNAPEEVARLKAQLGKDMSIGGTTLASSLAAAGLIDEYRLYVVPIVLGAGTRMFQHVNVPINLAPVETLEFTSGVILLKYRHQRETRLAI